MTALHLKALRGQLHTLTPSQAARIHIAGLVAECLKLQKEYRHGCTSFTHISPNIEMEERGIREDKGTAGAEDHPYTQVSYITCISDCMNAYTCAK